MSLDRARDRAARSGNAGAAVRRGSLNPASKKQLLRNSAFETLYKDPDFLKIVGPVTLG
jgi:hypothetical protein